MDIKLEGKKITIPDIKKCNLFWMIKGLMFTKRNKAKALLLFNFKKPRKAKIHSFFVFFPFIAVWLNDKNEVIEFKIVKPWIPLILPNKKFSKMVEIPINKKYSKIAEYFIK